MHFPREYYTSFIGPQRFVWLALTTPRLLRPSLKVALAALRQFFLPQFQTAIFRTRPVVYVDHRIDRAIPFQPSMVSLYMSFIPLWMNAVYCLHHRYGRAADARLAAFLEGIAQLYDEAGSIYLRCHSTTVRPRRLPNLSCAMIQVLDPHLNCIPSLHVTIVFGAWMLARGVIDDMGLPNAEDTGIPSGHTGSNEGEPRARAWLASLYNHAQRIAETTMLMKQHSVNCVGASLWYLHVRYPGSFSEDHCAAIIDGLFTLEGRDVTVKEEARARIREVFAILKQDAAGGGHWREPILRFLDGYPGTPPDFS